MRTAYQVEPYETTIGCSNIISSTGQIIEVGERGEIIDRLCSGFNISSNYFLTAGHCFGLGCFSEETSKVYFVNYNYQYSSEEEKSDTIKIE